MRLDYGFKVRVGVSGALGGSPYGATTIADVDGSREPHAEDFRIRRLRSSQSERPNQSLEPTAGRSELPI
jgi:hypothetical protein